MPIQARHISCVVLSPELAVSEVAMVRGKLKPVTATYNGALSRCIIGAASSVTLELSAFSSSIVCGCERRERNR